MHTSQGNIIWLESTKNNVFKVICTPWTGDSNFSEDLQNACWAPVRGYIHGNSDIKTTMFRNDVNLIQQTFKSAKRGTRNHTLYRESTVDCLASYREIQKMYRHDNLYNESTWREILLVLFLRKWYGKPHWRSKGDLICEYLWPLTLIQRLLRIKILQMNSPSVIWIIQTTQTTTHHAD